VFFRCHWIVVSLSCALFALQSCDVGGHSSKEQKPPGDSMNSLFVIAPYKLHGMWVFDDPKVGLSQEPFVSGADDIIDILTKDIPNADAGFALVFSHEPFPGHAARFVRGRPEHGGYWYSWPEGGKEGWLCPALFKYFPAAPKELYVKVSPK
jgi:hypothetical protein